ncbi:MAG: recombinase family protein [Oscillospiraceae bacterium]|nr:recombinase family protein [Oscillospiraceae bacterium]
MIFDMFVIQNKSLHKIVNHLRNEKIETAYIHFGYSRGNKDEPYKWNVFTIRRLLSYQEYCGDTVNGKTESISYKTKEKIRLPSSESGTGGRCCGASPHGGTPERPSGDEQNKGGSSMICF